jgi:hypothetical protein
MNTPNHGDKDEPLRSLLQQSRADKPLPPRFREQVWRRIEKDNCQLRDSLALAVSAWLVQVFSQRAVATAYLTVLIATGITAGYLQVQQRQERVDNELGARYVQSIDPYQKAGLSK